MSSPHQGPAYGHGGADGTDCAFLHLFGNTVLGRVLSQKMCDLDRNGGHYDVCRLITNPAAHAYAFAWGIAFALSKPEWAFQVLTEFKPDWQDPFAEGQWPLQIDDAVRHNPAEGHLQ